MKVTLSYALVTIDDAPLWLDSIGRYKLRVRKTPQDVREEREWRKRTGRDSKVIPYRMEDRSVMERDELNPSRLCFLPGLWPRVRQMLDSKHVEYEVDDQRDPSKKPPIDFQAIQDVEFREGQAEALALIATVDCGVIETTVGWGKSFLISVLCKAFPTLKILVCTSSLSVVSTLHEYLRQQIPREVGILGGGKADISGKRVVISTLRSLAKIPREWPDLVCCDECHDVSDNDAGHEIMQFYFARKFGFSASPVRNDGSQLAMEAIFGPTILKMSYQDSVDAGMVVPMKYVMVPCGWCPQFLREREGLSDVVLKRYSYWANKARNKAIASIVKDVWFNTDAQVLIMCATLEHAVYLHMLMPWMVVAYYGSVDMTKLREMFPKSKYPNLDVSKYKVTTKQLDITRRAFAKGTLRGVISTYVFRQGVNFRHLKVLVRADGATSTVAGIQIPGRLSRLDEGKDCAYLIDVRDTFTEWAVRRSETRAKLYQEQGWKEITREELLNDLRTEPDDKPDDTAGSCSAET